MSTDNSTQTNENQTAEIEKLRSELESTRTERDKLFKRALLQSMIEKDPDWISPRTTATLIEKEVGLKDEQLTGVREALQSLKAQSPYLTLSGNPDFAAKRQESQHKTAPPPLSQAELELARVKKLFGKGSDAKAANQLAMHNPKEYKRLKAVAETERLI